MCDVHLSIVIRFNVVRISAHSHTYIKGRDGWGVGVNVDDK